MPDPLSKVEKISSVAGVDCEVSSSLANAVIGILTKPPPKLNPVLRLLSRGYPPVLQASAFELRAAFDVVLTAGQQERGERGERRAGQAAAHPNAPAM